MSVLTNPRPVCRCSDCILSPEDSHGIHMVGMYRPGVYLRSRGGSLGESVRFGVGDRHSIEMRLPAHLCNGTEVSIP